MQKIKPLPGIFTVCPSGKKIRFAAGNLFWNGRNFLCEKHQYDSPKEWNPKHVGHFFWCEDPGQAVSETYNAPFETFADKLFAEQGRLLEGWTVLSEAEWDYLSRHAIGRYIARIAGENCTILTPDGVDKSVVALQYTAEEWTAAEEKYGLVALPMAGYRDGTKFCYGGYFVDLVFVVEKYADGVYWSKSHGYNPKEPECISFLPNETYTHIWNRRWASSIRLVENV